jgi:hypothetical protein
MTMMFERCFGHADCVSAPCNPGTEKKNGKKKKEKGRRKERSCHGLAREHL